MKTTVMMIGEFEFDDLFFDNISNSDKNKERMVLPYREATFVFFLVFMIIMSIIVMNLLVRSVVVALSIYDSVPLFQSGWFGC